MVAEFSSLLFRPICLSRRYRDRGDPLESRTPSSSFPLVFRLEHSSFGRLSDFLAFSSISQRLSAIEPFFNSFRHTLEPHQKYLEPPNTGFETERNR